MATPRPRPLIQLISLAILLTAVRVAASGAWFDDEPPHSLAGDLDRLPAKSLGEILLETAAKIPPTEAPKPVAPEEVTAIIEDIGSAKPAALAARIDDLAMRARATYPKTSELLAMLYDVRDAITAAGPAKAARQAYAQERVAKPPRATTKDAPDAFAKGDAMRAHRLYLEGAARFANGSRVECRPWFEEIVKQHPAHPRAETARFLLARCDLWSARYTGEDLSEAEEVERMAVAEAAFRDFLRLYPDGRYSADAHGWLGGIFWKTRPDEALGHFITQLEDPAHPECAKSAAHMIERVLSRIVANPEDPNEAVLKVVAQHPRIAQAAVYFVLNAPETDPSDGKYDTPDALKQWRLKGLPKLATAVSHEQKIYQGIWAWRLRAMLAQAASAAGHQQEAIKLTDPTGSELTQSDDLLFARLVALQRAGMTQEAIDAGLLFLKTYDASPLRRAVPIRLAQALVDAHRAGEAYFYLSQVDLTELNRYSGVYPPPENDLGLTSSAVYPAIDGTDAGATLKETIVNFAPLPELEAVLDRKEWQKKANEFADFKQILAGRKSANEDFSGAAILSAEPKFLARMTRYTELLNATSQGDVAARAQAMIALGDAFAADTEAYPAGPYLIWRDNARALGFSDPDQELESRNFNRHATGWWLRAARRLPATELSAKARFKVLEGIERTARCSDYDFTRAIESNLAKASRDILTVLRKESPNSQEARDAVSWNFDPAPKPDPQPGTAEDPALEITSWSVLGDFDRERDFQAASLLGGYHALPYDAFGDFEALSEMDNPDNPDTAALVKELDEVAVDPTDLPTQFPATLVRQAFETALTTAQNATQMKLANLFEDLTLFQELPDLNDSARNKYIQLRLRADDFPAFNHWEPNKKDPRPTFWELLANARKNPQLATVPDFIDYAELYANEADRGPDGAMEPRYPSYRSVEKGCRAFLEKYPKSPRRQACSLLLLRAIYRQLPERFGHAEKSDVETDSYTIVESTEPFRPASLLAAIAAYQKEFPQPRYPAEIRNFAAIIAWRTGHYGSALDLTIEQLDDERHPDLRREAAVRLANLFADLRDPRYRNAILEALRSRPAAQAKLKLYLSVAPHHAQHPLRCLSDFLTTALTPKPEDSKRQEKGR